MHRRTSSVLIVAAVGLLSIAACHRGVHRPPQVTPVNVALGDSLFNAGSCQRCHGKGGVGAQNAPALNDEKWLQLKDGSFEEIVKIITEGVPQTAIKDPAHRFGMRARGGPMNLSDAQVEAVAAYVWSLSHK